MTNMKNPLILILIFVIVIGLFFIPPLIPIINGVDPQSIGDFTLLVPFEYEILDIIYFHFISPIIMILFILIFTTIISPLLVKLHKTVKRKRYEYFILIDTGESLCLRGLIFRGLLIGF